MFVVIDVSYSPAGDMFLASAIDVTFFVY